MVNTLAPSFLIGSFIFLPETRACINAWMSLNFKPMHSLITEFAVLKRLNCLVRGAFENSASKR